MNNTNKIYTRVQTKPVGMPIPPALQDQYLKETFGWEPTKPSRPVEQVNSSAATPQGNKLAEFMKKYSHRVENTTQPGTVTQITGYPQPKKSSLTNGQINQEWEKEGNLLPDTEQDSIQIIMFRKTPIYPKRDDKK